MIGAAFPLPISLPFQGFEVERVVESGMREIVRPGLSKGVSWGRGEENLQIKRTKKIKNQPLSRGGEEKRQEGRIRKKKSAKREGYAQQTERTTTDRQPRGYTEGLGAERSIELACLLACCLLAACLSACLLRRREVNAKTRPKRKKEAKRKKKKKKKQSAPPSLSTSPKL